MIDLPIASNEPSNIRAAAASQGTNPLQRAASAPAGASAFQEALALELGLAPAAQPQPGPQAKAAPAKAGSLIESATDAAQTAAMGDIPVSLAYAGALAFSPAIAGAATIADAAAVAGAARAASGLNATEDATQTAAPGDAAAALASAAVLPAALLPYPPELPAATALPPAAAGALPSAAATGALLPSAAADATPPSAAPGLSLPPTAAGLSPLPAAAGLSLLPATSGLTLPPATSRASPLPAGRSAAGAAQANAAPDPRRARLSTESAAQDAGIQLSATADAANLSAPGKFAPPAEGELRGNAGSIANWLDRHTAAPAPAASPAAAAALANHADGAAPLQALAAPAATLAARVGERGWDSGLGDKLVWMAGQKHQVAELHLNPPDLGPLKITLTLNDDQASAQFVSAHLAVREAIESAMPRLREMLADNGIMLGNASVSADGFREQTPAQQQARAYPAQDATAAESRGLARGEMPLRRAQGLVDTFA